MRIIPVQPILPGCERPEATARPALPELQRFELRRLQEALGITREEVEALRRPRLEPPA